MNNCIQNKVNPTISNELLESRKQRLIDPNFKLSIIVPAHNESEGIINFINNLTKKLNSLSYNYDVILIDDGSKDNTCSIIEKYIATKSMIKLLKLSRNFGKEIALSAGLDHCQGDMAILIDGDSQHPLDLIDNFIDKWADGFDMVYGIQENRYNESIIKRVFTRVFYKLMRSLTSLNIVANAGDFRLLDRKVINALNSCKEKAKFMKGLYTWVGYKSIGIPFTPLKRTTGKSSWSFTKLTDLAMLGITSFSNAPLRVWSFIGFGISFVSLICALFVISKTILFGIDVPGYATLLVTIIFFGGIQIFSIGILGEYLARVFNEVKNRPTYIVEKKVNFE